MARARGEKQYVALTKGLITEASPLAAPEGSTSDELNMDLDLDGMIRRRRLGLAKAITDQSLEGIVTGSYYWSAANQIVVSALSDNPDETVDTVTLYFHDGDDLSALYSYTFEVLEDTASTPSFSEIRNRLAVTFGTKPFIFKKEASGNLTGFSIDLYVRDFKLVDDDLTVGERPATLSNEHEYNLYNAGWYQSVFLETEVEGDPITDFFDRLAVYPSNADLVYLGFGVLSSGVEYFNGDFLKTPKTGNSEAARGHYIYNIRNINRTSKLTNKDEDGAVPKTTELVLDDGTNVSGNPGNLLFTDAAPAGDPVDPYIPPYKPGGVLEID